MLLPILSILGGLVLLVWSADKFVDGAARTARHFGMAPLLIGMVIVGFGTSAPEMVVSLMAALEGNPGIAMGNAYGSNIGNITLILGVTALMGAIAVHSNVLKKEMPILLTITVMSVALLYDGQLSRADAWISLGVFAAYMGWAVWTGIKTKQDALGDEMSDEYLDNQPIGKSIMWLVIGLILLIISSRFLVWGAVEVATAMGVSDLIVGLTIVAVGTSLPELASSIIAARKGEHDIALGNIVGSNLFNTLAVVGIAGAVAPMKVPGEVFWRDGMVMIGVTVLLFLFCYGFRGKEGRITRLEGGILLSGFVAYTGYLVTTAF
ncbi:calcium/sodium antiporter [Armatimonadetes bacterium Uphvl-Ar1]|nr:calcium/sodium antiporter [Armatimonadetes bacterium Uphvl-Ar1]